MDILGWWWKDIPIVDSTNNIGLALSSNPPAEKYVITAEVQTSGKGRRGRTWYSKKGNLFATFALKDKKGLINFLPFILSLSLFDCVKSILPDEDISLKWPNDVLLRGCKLAGILLEKGESNYIIAGIGVNLVSSPSNTEDILYPVISLAECGVIIDYKSFLRSYIKFLNSNLETFYSGKSESIIKEWIVHAHYLGGSIVVRGENYVREGVFAGIASDGALILEENDHKHKIYAGDIFYK